jgi:HPt (histidine-containing phosphotransfer) domain-containing protein
MAQSAHRLKSSAASFGATRLSQATASIEAAARAGDFSAAAGRMDEFRRLSEASAREMERFRQGLAGGDGQKGDRD